ncbi:MAG: hypothetical protein HFE75_02550 [Firmicutes bacterium]|jgi:hypothetical protein|nr:hypothetical protein [Bacillota bacterium]
MRKLREIGNGLEGDKDHYVYVTLNQRMPYEAFKSYIDKNEELRGIWYAVSTNVPLTESVSIDQTLGFSCAIETSSLLEENPETYPELFLLPRGLSMKEGEQREEDLKKESYMKKHFASQLRYLADQKRFLHMIYPEADSKEIARELKAIANYVEKHGLLIHGFACRADKEALLKLVDEKNVYDIMPAQQCLVAQI